MSSKVLVALAFTLALPLFASAQGATTFSASLDKSSYVWGNPITITLSVSSSTKSLLFDAIIKNEKEQVCAVITKDQPIRSNENSLTPPIPTKFRDNYSFTLPEKGCVGIATTTTISVIVRTQGGTLIDSKIFPVTISAPPPPHFTVAINRLEMLLLVLVSGILGYFVWRKRKLVETKNYVS